MKALNLSVSFLLKAKRHTKYEAKRLENLEVISTKLGMNSLDKLSHFFRKMFVSLSKGIASDQNHGLQLFSIKNTYVH